MVASGKKVVAFAVVVRVIINCDFAIADHFERSVLHYDRGAFIDTNPQQIWMSGDNRHEILLPAHAKQVRHNDQVLNETKTLVKIGVRFYTRRMPLIFLVICEV